MEPLNENSELQQDQQQDLQSVGDSEKKSTFQKISKRSKANKFLFLLLGGVLVLVVGYMVISSKINELERQNALMEQSQSDTNSASISKEQVRVGSERDVLNNPEHIQAAKQSIRDARREAIITGKADSTSSVADFKAESGFYEEGVNGNNKIASDSGGQSFDLDLDFNTFVDNERKKVKVTEPEPVEVSVTSNKKVQDSTPKPDADQKHDTRKYTIHSGVVGLAQIRRQQIGLVLAQSKQQANLAGNVSIGGRVNGSQITSSKRGSNERETSRSLFNSDTVGLEATSNSSRSRYASVIDNNPNSLITTTPTNEYGSSGNRFNSQPQNQFNNSSTQEWVGNANTRTNDIQNIPPQLTMHSMKINNGSRGLFVGDKMLGETTHGLHSGSQTMFLIVDLIQGPLKGARIVYEPTLTYDTFVFKSSVIQYKGNQAPFSSIIITPDDTLTTSFRSGVDYHTLFNLGMVFVSGISQGAADFISSVADKVVVDGSTVTSTVEFSTEKLLWSAFGGVAQAAQPLVEKQLNKEPTVWVDPFDVVGVMMVSDWNAEWSPIINEDSLGIF